MLLKSYLNMNINKHKREKKVATLSIVLSMTMSCRLKAGMKRTSLSMRNKRKVLSTLTPLDVATAWLASGSLKEFSFSITSYMLTATITPSNML